MNASEILQKTLEMRKKSHFHQKKLFLCQFENYFSKSNYNILLLRFIDR